jgi:hypothetical protein
MSTNYRLTAYDLFQKERIEILREDNLTLSSIQYNKIIGREWKLMNWYERSKYENRAKRERYVESVYVIEPLDTSSKEEHKVSNDLKEESNDLKKYRTSCNMGWTICYMFSLCIRK